MITPSDIKAFDTEVLNGSTPDYNIWMEQWSQIHVERVTWYQARMMAYDSFPTLVSVSTFFLYVFENCPRPLSQKELLGLEREFLTEGSQTHQDFHRWVKVFQDKQPHLTKNLAFRYKEYGALKGYIQAQTYAAIFLLHQDKKSEKTVPVFVQNTDLPQ